MTERPCIRCHHPLLLEDGQLSFCTVCGAPQIFLSEALQEQAAADLQRYREGGAPAAAPAFAPGTAEPRAAGDAFEPGAYTRTPVPPPPPGAALSRFAALRRIAGAGRGRWPVAVEYALLSSAIALGLDLLGILFSPLLFLAWLWVVSAPMLTVSFYSSKAHGDRFSPGFAARLGLLTGLLVTVSCAVVFTGGLVLARFAFHDAAIDAQIHDAVTQIRANAVTQYGAAAQPVLALLGVPEFRVGMLLWMCSVTAAIYLVLSAATAGVAGLLLGRRRPA